MSEQVFVCPLSEELKVNFLEAARKCRSTGECCWNWSNPNAVRSCEYYQESEK